MPKKTSDFPDRFSGDAYPPNTLGPLLSIKKRKGFRSDAELKRDMARLYIAMEGLPIPV